MQALFIAAPKLSVYNTDSLTKKPALDQRREIDRLPSSSRGNGPDAVASSAGMSIGQQCLLTLQKIAEQFSACEKNNPKELSSKANGEIPSEDAFETASIILYIPGDNLIARQAMDREYNFEKNLRGIEKMIAN